MNSYPTLETPLVVTTIGPVVAPDGTGVTMEVLVQDDGLAGVLLKVTVPEEPKLTPVIVIS